MELNPRMKNRHDLIARELGGIVDVELDNELR
jgi:hypothetical protein